jgi:hypothetical protein
MFFRLGSHFKETVTELVTLASCSKGLAMRLIFLPALILFCLPRAAADDEIVTTTSRGSASLGGAYQDDKEAFVGQECITGEKENVGSSNSTFSLTQSMAESRLADELGFSAGGRGRFGVVEASASADFFSKSVSNSFTTSAIYSAAYNFPAQKLKGTRLTDIGSAVQNNDDRWNKTCGNGYVAEIRSGAKLFFSIVVEFQSAEQKQQFDAKFSISGPLAGASGELSKATAAFGRNIKVRINALQIGGDVSKLTSLFPNTEAGRQSFLDCTLGKFESCADFLGKALQYATAVDTGFPSQLKPDDGKGAATFSYRIVPYSAAGIFPKGYPSLEQATLLARKELSETFEKMFRLSVDGDRLLRTKLTTPRRSALEKERAKVKENITAILAASKTCYEAPADCPKAVNQDLQIARIDESQFSSESFASVCSEASGMDANNPLRITVDAIKHAVDRDGVKDGGAPRPLDCAGYEKALANIKALNLGPQELDDKAPPPISPISDLSPFSSLINLEAVAVPFSRVTDLSPLTALPKLKDLEVLFNPISDLSPLETMTELEVFNCSFCAISNLTPLGSLTKLRMLDLTQNRITDLTPLSKVESLEMLRLDKNRIGDLTPLSNLKGLVSLSAQDNNIVKLEPLSRCTALKVLNLNSNGIADFTNFTPPARLFSLWLAFNPVMNDPAKIKEFQDKYHVAVFPLPPPQK